MVTIPGNKFASLSTSFDNSSSFRELVPDTVYLDVEKWDWFAHNPIKISLLTLLPAIPCRISRKIVAEFSDKALSRPSTRLAEGANGSAGDIVSHGF
jgi:hypothetical protein